MIDILTTYAPQRIFLVQGSEHVFTTYVTQLNQTRELVHTLSVPRFTTDHARDVAQFALEGDGTERGMVVYFSLFSPDAAQILLKSLEEPDPTTTIVFVTPYPYVVPITIRSRVALIHTWNQLQSPMSAFSKSEAFEYVKKELGGDSEEDAATRKAKAIAYLDQLELHHRTDSTKVHAIYTAKDMLLQANMPTKFVMEYVLSML